MNDEKLFCCCNILNFLEKNIKEQRKLLVENKNANNENLLGFDYGVEVTISLLKAIIHSAEVDKEILVYSDKLNTVDDMEEFDLHELLKHFDCRITMQTKN